MARDDPDFAIRDLYNAIAQGDYPSYTMYIQVMSFEVSLKKKVLGRANSKYCTYKKSAPPVSCLQNKVPMKALNLPN